MVAWLSLLVAVLALIYAWWRDRKQSDALERERVERKEADGAAHLVGETSGRSSSSSGVTYPVTVRNIGKSPAYDAYIWICIDAGPVTNQHPVGVLVPGDDPIVLSLSQGRVGPEPHERPGSIRAGWKDGNGEHRDEEIGRTSVYL